MDNRININHGSGGKSTNKLIQDVFLKHFNSEPLKSQSDSAVLGSEWGDGEMLAFTTDCFVVDPIFFPGGDIGKLAVCGTVNDLAVTGAVPKYISIGFIIEEGFSISDLEKLAQSISKEADFAKVKIVAGDTKVVPNGKADKIFINTSGIGYLKPEYKNISVGKDIKVGDKVILNGSIGDHAIAVLGARSELKFDMEIVSDCCSLNHVIKSVLDGEIHVKFMRDATRGGVATVLNEIVNGRDFSIEISEEHLPINDNVKGICELLGFDPLFLANEGKVVFIVDNKDADKALNILRDADEKSQAAIIGEIAEESKGKVVLNTYVGGKRIVNMLYGEQLPRIC